MKRFDILATGAIALAAAVAAPLAAQAPRAAPRLAPAPGTRINAEYMIGMWSDREDCGNAIEFRRDGRFLNPDGSSGTWQVNDAELTLTGTRTVTVRLVPRGRDETIVVQANGTLGYSRRCHRPTSR